MLIVSIVAIYGKTKGKHGWLSFWTIIPQQILLMLSAWGSFFAVYNSMYADGVVRSRHFIFDDQWQNMITMLLHSFYLCTLLVNLLRNKTDISK